MPPNNAGDATELAPVILSAQFFIVNVIPTYIVV